MEINTNGHTYVDLGLPSGTLWAKTNVGAKSVTDFGNYYKCSDIGVTDVVFEEKWKLPTLRQCIELLDHTTNKWVNDYKNSGINGWLFISPNNGNELFFPAAGLIKCYEISGHDVRRLTQINDCGYMMITEYHEYYNRNEPWHAYFSKHFGLNCSNTASTSKDAMPIRGVISK